MTIAIAGCVWYVQQQRRRQLPEPPSAPFDTLAQAETASAANHTVFVFDGDNTSTGYGGDGYTMNTGERLIGEHEGLVRSVRDTLHPANPGAHPTLTATNADVIDLDDGNEVRGFNLDPQGAGGGIAGATGDTAAARSTTSTSPTPARRGRSPGSSSTAPPARSTSPTSPSAPTAPLACVSIAPAP